MTGDLIGSTHVDPARIDHTMSAIGEATAFIGRETDAHFTRFRGDGWQLYLRDPGDFLWVAVYLNAVLRADPDCINTRIAIGIGAINDLGKEDLSGASGEAFTNSGRALDKIGAGEILALAGAKTNTLVLCLLGTIADYIADWSLEQAEVVKAMLDSRQLGQNDSPRPPTQSDIAQKLGITRQAVAGRLKAAHFARIYQASFAFRDHYAQPEP